MSCKVCGTTLTGRQRRYCTKKCRRHYLNSLRKGTTKYHFTIVCPDCEKLGALVERIEFYKGKPVKSSFRVDHKVTHYL